jgi:trimeric autotransporter adhesin
VSTRLGPALDAGGTFTISDEVSANRIAKWNGGQWSTLTSGTNFPAHALIPFDDGTGPTLNVGGDFTIAGGSASSRVAAWSCARP